MAEDNEPDLADLLRKQLERGAGAMVVLSPDCGMRFERRDEPTLPAGPDYWADELWRQLASIPGALDYEPLPDPPPDSAVWGPRALRAAPSLVPSFLRDATARRVYP